MNDKILGFNRNIFFTGLTSFFTDISTKMLYSIMPLFLLSIGASKTTIALIEGIAESTASLLKAVLGRWSDKLSKSKHPSKTIKFIPKIRDFRGKYPMVFKSQELGI